MNRDTDSQLEKHHYLHLINLFNGFIITLSALSVHETISAERKHSSGNNTVKLTHILSATEKLIYNLKTITNPSFSFLQLIPFLKFI